MDAPGETVELGHHEHVASPGIEVIQRRSERRAVQGTGRSALVTVERHQGRPTCLTRRPDGGFLSLESQPDTACASVETRQ